MKCRCGHTAEHHAMQGRNPALSFCVEQCCPCEAFAPKRRGPRMAPILLGTLLWACGGSTESVDSGCPTATPDQCAYMQNQCESYCEHKCLGEQSCVSACWSDECGPFEQQCPTTCESCVPTFTLTGPQTICDAPCLPAKEACP